MHTPPFQVRPMLYVWGGWLGLTHSTGSVASEALIVEQDQGRSEQDGTV